MAKPEYPDLKAMCRLCLEKSGKLIDIFSGCDAAGREISTSVAIKIMSCTALEVKSNDDLPKNICLECMHQLEESYYFRKRSQIADTKLKKHSRLLNLGRRSMVFDAASEDDDFDDELDSLWQIITRARQVKYEEIRHNLMNDMKEEKENFKKQLTMDFERKHEEQKTLLRLEVKEELRDEVAKELREKISQECRNQEMQNLLQELEEFLKEKRCGIDRESSTESSKSPGREETRYVGMTRKRVWSGSATNSKAAKKSNQIFEITQVVSSSEEFQDDFQDQDADAETGSYILTSVDADDFGDNDEEYPFEDSPQNNVKQVTYQIEDNGEIGFLKQDDNHRLSPIKDGGGQQEMHIVSVKGERTDLVELLEVNKDTMKMANIKTCKSPLKKSPSKKKLIRIPPVIAEPVPQRVTETPKTFKCGCCPRSFSTLVSLNRHVSLHNKQEQKGIIYKCDKCHVILSCRSALNRHMIIHTGERPYRCDICGKAFVQREILKRHMAIHSGERPYKCEHCERSFTQKVNLTQHVKTKHMPVPEVREHACHLCNKCFNHKSGLSRHLASHNGFVFECILCGKRFSDRSSVKRHIQHVHGVSEQEKVESIINKVSDNSRAGMEIVDDDVHVSEGAEEVVVISANGGDDDDNDADTVEEERT